MLALDFIIRMKIPFISLKIRSLIYLLFIFFANIFNLVSLTEDSIKFCKNDYFKGNIFDFLKN